jgi:hypothetical protein
VGSNLGFFIKNISFYLAKSQRRQDLLVLLCDFAPLRDNFTKMSWTKFLEEIRKNFNPRALLDQTKLIRVDIF